MPLSSYLFVHNKIQSIPSQCSNPAVPRHLLPHSKGGKTELRNLALAINVNNFQRSNKPLSGYLTRDMFETYCKQFEEIKLPTFDGKRYIRELAKTVDRLLKQGGS